MPAHLLISSEILSEAFRLGIFMLLMLLMLILGNAYA